MKKNSWVKIVLQFIVRAFGYFSRMAVKGFVLVSTYPFFWFLHLGKKSTNISPIFIVGAPRTGSTIFYQALTNCYEVTYVDNLASSWSKMLPFGVWLSSIKYGNRPHDNYVAEFGNTLKYGGHAPSECGDFWYRWLSAENHFVDYNELSEQSVCQIRSELNLIMSKTAQPILFKNLNMGQRLGLVRDLYPDAKIVFIRRDPRFVVRSILEARRKLGLSKYDWWSVKPKNFEAIANLPEVEMCAAQVFYIEEQIKEDLRSFDSKNVVTLHFNELSEGKIDELSRQLGLARKPDSVMPKFLKDNVGSPNLTYSESVESAVRNFAFDKELFS